MQIELINWYHQNKRDLPWRNTRDPYRIWVSEIILQQTRISTGITYYHRFIQAFPNIRSLSLADEIEILNIWQGLGYYNRALNMLKTAKIIMSQHGGVFPKNYNVLIKLTGIGPYTAAAISSICANEKQAVVDGNVFRVLSRFYNIKTAINTTEGKKEFTSIANSLISDNEPGIYNQAIMDFGSTHCKKSNPKCLSCPIKKDCQSLKLELINQRPVKNKLFKIKTRYLNYLFISDTKNFLIEQRNDNDIWKKLYQLPLIEHTKFLTKTDIKKHHYLQLHKIKNITNKYKITHRLTHQKLEIVFWKILVPRIFDTQRFKKIDLIDKPLYPFPKPIQLYFNSEHI